jgi:hypothetical protein
LSSFTLVRRAAMYSTGWCAFRYAVWYAISAYPHAWEALKP